MKRQAALIVTSAAIGLMCIADVSARGGRGGGGGGRGGGGASRPAPSRPAPSRSPSMSRSAPKPSASRPSGGGATRPQAGGGSRPQAGGGARPKPGGATRPSGGSGPGGRPSQGDLQNFLDVPKPGSGAARPGGGAAAGGGAATDFLNNKPSQAGGRTGASDRAGAENRSDRAGDRGDRRGEMAGNRPDRIDNRQELQGNRVERRDEVRNQVRENNPRLDFWSDHPNWARRRINRPYRWATWGALTGWFSFGWNDPVSYSYGEDVYYQDDSVYYGDEEYASTDEYAQQAEAIATSAPEETAETEWLSLGVFAVTQDGEASGPDPSVFLQLAVSKEGVIAGTFQDTGTDKSGEIEGMVDSKSQRVAWTVTGKTRPLIETGISNLTQDTAPVLVHFEDGQTQQWLLVRLEEPEGEAASQ